MEGNSFWLIYVQDEKVIVVLVKYQNNQYQVLSTGPNNQWDVDSEKTFITAVDESLSAASLNANFEEDQEPENAAFVVPPFWIDNDGKISAPKLKLIKSLCKELKLKPTGFLSEDEAIIEESNQKDEFPASFILVHINEKEFYLSLVYLGNIKERIRKKIINPFSGQLLESTILELNSDSALPPQIILFGPNAEKYLDGIKNFSWVGKKDIETFLHFPDVKTYSETEIINIFSKVITAQIQPNQSKEEMKEKKDQELLEENDSSSKVEELTLNEIDAASLGFSDTPPLVEETIDNQEKEIENNDKEAETSSPFKEDNTFIEPIAVNKENKKNFLSKISFSFLKKIKAPKFKKSNFQNLLWISLIILPILLFSVIFFSKAKVTLFITPFAFEKEIPVTLLVDGSIDDISKSVIPVQKKVFDSEATSTISTTGQKTIGERAKGEIVIYNKSDESQKVSAGSILVDDSGKKFELTNDVSIASSSSNLDEGVITLGQTKTALIASDIGSEFNINEGLQLTFEDFTSSVLIARTSQSLSGGSKRQANAVSKEDKEIVEEKLDGEIEKDIENKTKNEVENLSGILENTIQISKDKVELSREIGEEADELVASVEASVSVFVIESSIKEELLSEFLSDQENFNQTDINLENFTFDFKTSKVQSQKATGVLTIKGTALPKIDVNNLKKLLTFKSKKNAFEIIKQNVSRAYNFHIDNTFSFAILPVRLNNISIEIKSESL